MISKAFTKIKKMANGQGVFSKVYNGVHSFAFTCTRLLPDKAYFKLLCHLYGRKMDVDHPKTFDEKLWWLKLNNRDPLLTICSDKYAVREYVAKKGYEDILIEQVGVYNNVDEIDFDSFDEEVILKNVSGSGKNYFFKKGRDEDRIPSIKKNLKKSLKQNPFYLSREWNYKNVPKKIIADKVIRDSNGHCPLDYKFMCFDGVPKLLFLDIGLIDDNNIYNHHYPRNVYDMDFNLLPIWETRENSSVPIEKPVGFERMVEIAKALCEPFPHCRVDLYNIDGKIYFGEITFYHGGGFNDIRPEEWDYRIGSWIDINSPKIHKK